MNPQDIIAVCALGTSLISLAASITFSILQAQHNRNSVRPIASIQIGDYEDSIFVEVHNSGTGPLIIKKLYCNCNGKQYDSLIELFTDVTQLWDDFVENVDGRVIPVGGRIVLLRISPTDDTTRTSIRKTLGNATIDVSYSDIYCSGRE